MQHQFHDQMFTILEEQRRLARRGQQRDSAALNIILY